MRFRELGLSLQRETLKGDLLAGLTLWAVFAAQSIAYSRLALATPVAGLITGIAGALIYALLGTSRRVSIGPAGGIAAIVGSAVAGVSADRVAGSIMILTLLTGTILVLASLARLTFIARLFPTPVFVGYLAGIGVTIVTGQARELVGHGTFPLLIGLVAIAGVLTLKKLAPRVPGPFVILVIATIASSVFHFARRGVPIIGSTLGHLGPLSLPSGFGWSSLRHSIGPALSLAMLVYVDALAQAEDLTQEGDPPIRPRREYLALGAVNIVAGLFGGFVAGCSSSRTIVGIRSGERTKLAGAIAGVLLVLTALSVVRFLEPMPLAALAGVVFVAAFDLIDLEKLRELWTLRRVDLLIALAAALGVIAVGPIAGAACGVLLALAEAFRRAMNPERGVLSPRIEQPDSSANRLYRPFGAHDLVPRGGIIIYRFGAPLFFGNADVFLSDMKAVAEAAPPDLRSVVVNADTLGVPDASAREALLKAQSALSAKGISLVIGNARKPTRDALRKVAAFEIIDEKQFIADLGLAGVAV